jgi:HD superfamily phosphohydrolase
MENIDLINEINPVHKFRDPIYGYIWLTENEKNIIDQDIFQRLRRIHQLALTKYVYPTAKHSRFTHSLGVLQSAANFIYIILI